jgi:hypothetical protein
LLYNHTSGVSQKLKKLGGNFSKAKEGFFKIMLFTNFSDTKMGDLITGICGGN